MSNHRPGRHRRASLIAVLLLAALVGLAGCDEGLTGTYADPVGTGSVEFRKDGTVYVEILGMTFAGEYEQDGDRVIIKGPNGTQVYRLHGDRLEAGLGLVFIRQ